MAEQVPEWLAKTLHDPRAGHAGLAAAKLAQSGMAGKGGFALSSAAFTDGGALDPSFTAEEEDAVAPPVEWTAPPAGTQELALIVESPASAGGAQPACHWLVWGLPPQRGQILEGEVPQRVGKNAMGNSEWLLPDPPGSDRQDYIFQLFALDLPLTLMPGATREQLLAEMEGHVLAVALLTGTYRHEEGEAEDWEADEDA